jgi:hypothetical protein
MSKTNGASRPLAVARVPLPGAPGWQPNGGSLLERRAKGGALLSIRVPVTLANRSLLRTLRAEEQAAWEALEGEEK